MAYKVITEARAEQDALNYAAFILSESQSNAVAAKWLTGLEEAIEGLAEMPRRFRVIDEQDRFSIELRQLLYHSHRVIYHVRDETQSVHVVRIYHGRRDEVEPQDVQTPFM